MINSNTILQGRYVILNLLGQGGMGAVYLAKDQRLGHLVAIKETFFSDSNLRQAFQREAQLLARLRHPALPVVSDHFVEGDGQFLVMQYISGDDLHDILIKKGSPFSPNEVLRWADQLLGALEYLHTQKPPVIHRDIKPQNLKLTEQDQIILLDFGLAKGSVAETTQANLGSSIFGYTLNYAPLEQMQGMGTDQRSDLYALGATLHYLLTGDMPTDALTRATNILNKKPDPLRTVNEINLQVTATVASVLMQAMALDREERPATAAEMRKALSNASSPIISTAQTQVDEPPTIIAESSVIQAGLGTTIKYGHEMTEKVLSSPSLQNRRPLRLLLTESKRLTWIVGGFLALLVTAIVVALVYKNKISSPGPLSNVHAATTMSEREIALRPADGSCIKCHSEATSKENQCISCHKTKEFNPTFSETNISKGHIREGIGCVKCHSEHKGKDFSPGVVESNMCMDCHNGSYSIRTGVNAGDVLPTPHGQVGYPVTDGKWTWHLSVVKLRMKGLPKKWVDFSRSQQFHALHSFDKDRVSCVDCHSAGIRGDELFLMSPRGECAKCHPTGRDIQVANCLTCHLQHKESRTLNYSADAPSSSSK